MECALVCAYVCLCMCMCEDVKEEQNVQCISVYYLLMWGEENVEYVWDEEKGDRNESSTNVYKESKEAWRCC